MSETENPLEHLVGQRVAPKQDIPSDHRGRWIERGTVLIVARIVGPKHVELNWPNGRLAAGQVHIGKLRTA